MPFYALSFRFLIDGIELIHSFETDQDTDLRDARQKSLKLGDAFDPRTFFFTMSLANSAGKTSFRVFSYIHSLLYRPYVVKSVSAAASISKNINSITNRFRKNARQRRTISKQTRLLKSQPPLAYEQIVLSAKVTEKSLNRMSRYGQYYFFVHRNATKTQIKEAVENLFQVRVDKVRTQNIRASGKRQAIVKLRPGQTINDLSSLLSPMRRGPVHT
jgi:ribosomal protein L23